MQVAITGLPEWISVLAVLLLVLVTLAYLVIPFTVMGYGVRLQDLEDQLDRMRLDIRELTVVVAEASQREPDEDRRPRSRHPPGNRTAAAVSPALAVQSDRRWVN